eukprot:1195636-Prorocentrum_minimum.AAC.8
MNHMMTMNRRLRFAEQLAYVRTRKEPESRTRKCGCGFRMVPPASSSLASVFDRTLLITCAFQTSYSPVQTTGGSLCFG